MKKHLLGALAGGATLFLTGYLIYVLLLPNPSFAMGEGAQACMRTAFNYPMIVLMEICYGLLLTLIFNKWAGITSFNGGLSAGAWIGFLLGLTFGLWEFSVTTMTTAGGIFYEAITFAVRFALAGGVVGWLLGKVKD